MSKLYNLKLTALEVYHLMSSYEASFTQPESKNAAERSITEKINRLYLKSSKEPRATPSIRNKRTT